MVTLLSMAGWFAWTCIQNKKNSKRADISLEDFNSSDDDEKDIQMKNISK